MKTFNLEECSIPGSCTANLKNDTGIMYQDFQIMDLFRVLFSAITQTLNSSRTKTEDRVGFALRDKEGNFKVGMSTYFIKPEDSDEEDSGNWYLEGTFDEADLEGCNIVIGNNSDLFVQCMARQVADIMYGKFQNLDVMNLSLIYIVNTLIDFLDTNASDTEEVEVDLKGVFKASVAVEDGIKIMSLVPGEIIKQAIKKDAIL